MMVDYTGAVRDGCLDYSSPFFVSSGAKGAYVVTDDGSTIRVYRSTDIEVAGTIAWTLCTGGSFNPGAGWNGKVRIISSREELNFVAIAYKDQTGVYVARSTAGTPSFGAAVQIGAAVTDTAHDNDELAFGIFDEMQVVLAPDGTTSTEDGEYKYFPYVATTKGGSFSVVGSVPAAVTRAVLGCVMPTSATVFYVPMEKPVAPTVTPLIPVTFDGSGWTNYTITGAGTTSGLGANPPVAYNAVNTAGAGLSNAVAVRVNFEADYILNGITWVAAESGGTLTGKSFMVRLDCFDAENTLVKRIERTDSIAFIQGMTADDLELEVPVRAIEVTLTLTWTSDTGSGINNVFIDDIGFTAILVTQEATRKLYQVTLPSTWLDVTPSQIAVPITPYGMAFDNASPNTMAMLAINEQGNVNLLHTGNGGSSWSTHKRNVRYRGVKRGGDTLILWGYNCIDLSPDAGFTTFARIGAWAQAVGAVDEIRWVAGVL